VLRPVAASDGSTMSSTVEYSFRITNNKNISGKNLSVRLSYQATEENNVKIWHTSNCIMSTVLDFEFRISINDISKDAKFVGNIIISIEATDANPNNGGTED